MVSTSRHGTVHFPSVCQTIVHSTAMPIAVNDGSSLSISCCSVPYSYHPTFRIFFCCHFHTFQIYLSLTPLSLQYLPIFFSVFYLAVLHFLHLSFFAVFIFFFGSPSFIFTLPIPNLRPFVTDVSVAR